MTNEKIINRINNLLAKTVENGCTPEEAAAAAAKAQELIAKHHIDMRDAGEEVKEDIGACIETFSRSWESYLATVLTANTCCKVIVTADRKKLVFMGKETDLQAVLTMYDTFTTALKQGIKEEKARMKELYGTTAKAESSFALGFIQAIDEEMSKQCRALQLVTPEDVTQKFYETFPTAKEGRARSVTVNKGSFNRGHTAGQQAAGRKEITC